MSVETSGPEDLARAETLRIGGEDQGYSWVIVAGMLSFLLGTVNFIEGIAAISGSHFFTNHARYIFGDLNSWGWVVMLIGIAQGATGFGIFIKNQLARLLGVGFAFLNALAQLLMMPAYPFWSLAMLSLDILVMYGLIRYSRGAFLPA